VLSPAVLLGEGGEFGKFNLMLIKDGVGIHKPIQFSSIQLLFIYVQIYQHKANYKMSTIKKEKSNLQTKYKQGSLYTNNNNNNNNSIKNQNYD
jgi:hypothetical protein